MQSGKEVKDKNIEINKKYGLTPALKIDIEVYYPKAEDLITRNINKPCCRDIETYRENCKMLFPMGRVFASWKPLE